MASFLSVLNPIVSFPNYHGPYAVGTVDVEVPAAHLPSPCEPPEGAVPTISFRIFYPCKKPSSSESNRPVRWIPSPQRPTLAAFARFLGVQNPKIATLISYMSQQLYWISIPAHRNAKILEPPTRIGRWPVTMFSHGLAGSRNAYSHVCGELASNGMVVIALDHRDGSSPIQYVRATDGSEARIIDPVKISHDPSPEVYQGRDKQLRIRLWEISAAYEALMKIDQGQRLENLDINASTNRKERVEVLAQFDGMMDIHRAGKVTFAGHSYGACTAVQLVKSIFYHKERPKDAGIPLISPNVDAAIAHQIMPESPMLLLDMWGLPFKSPDQAYLWDKPLPSHAVGGPEGSNVISILSEAFHNWDANTTINKHIVAAPSLSRRPSTAPRLSREPGQLLPSWAHLARDESPSMDSGYASNSPLRAPARSHSKSADHSQTSAQQSRDGSQKSRSTSSDSANPIHRLPGPHMFYVKQSQHFNQSDFGLLFPWIAKRVTKAEDPERIMELNARAMAQVLRQSGIDVAGEDDPEILDKNSKVPRWTYIPVEEEESTVGTGAIARKLSVVSSKSAPSPRDGMTMGMKTDAQLPKLDLPEAAQS